MKEDLFLQEATNDLYTGEDAYLLQALIELNELSHGDREREEEKEKKKDKPRSDRDPDVATTARSPT